MRFIIYIVILIISIFFIVVPSNITINNVAIGVASGLILLIVEYVSKNFKWLKYLWWTIIYCNTSIRLSISYLYRIKLNNEYFLIKGERIENQYQPVGGVYKRYDSSKDFFTKIGALDDDLFPIDESSKNDLRIRIKGRYLLEFIRWFDSKVQRETCPWREFYEELIDTNIISHNQFPYIFADTIKQHVSSVSWSDYTQSKELLIADIYEPILNEEQISEFRSLKDNSNEKYYFANEDQINRLGIISKKEFNINIAKIAQWII